MGADRQKQWKIGIGKAESGCAMDELRPWAIFRSMVPGEILPATAHPSPPYCPGLFGPSSFLSPSAPAIAVSGNCPPNSQLGGAPAEYAA